MAQAPSPQDKSAPKVREMFGRVAPVYDRVNHVLSASLDRLWRRRAAAALNGTTGPVLDLCCGTGDQALALASRGGPVTAADFCLPMLALARPKFARLGGVTPTPLAADALHLPFADASFDATTITFGIRNVADVSGALDEITRVLTPGGQLVILEFALPDNRLVRALYLFYFRRILPRLGRWLSSDPSAYEYLAESVEAFPQRHRFLKVLETAGFVDPSCVDLSAGTVCLYTARRYQ